jgi:hypothetical protein
MYVSKGELKLKADIIDCHRERTSDHQNNNKYEYTQRGFELKLTTASAAAAELLIKDDKSGKSLTCCVINSLLFCCEAKKWRRDWMKIAEETYLCLLFML